MKILIINQKEFPHKEGIFYGGIQKVEKDQAICLARRNHEVTSFMTSECEPYGNGITSHYSSATAQWKLSTSEKAKQTKTRKKEILELIQSSDFDCVIVHDWSGSIQNLFHKEFVGIPSILYLHNTPLNSGGIQMFGRIHSYVRHHKHGGVSCVVSNTAKKLWEDAILKKIQSERQRKMLDEDVIEHFMKHQRNIFDISHPAMLEVERKPLATEHYATMISRLNASKGIVKAAKMASKMKIPLKLICPSPNNQEEHDLVEKFCEFQSRENIHFSIPREEMFEILKKSKIHFIPSEESFSLVAVEANSCGTPCIIYSPAKYVNSPHEATIGNDKYNIAWTKATEKEIIQTFSSFEVTQEQRRVIASDTFFYYNWGGFADRLEELIKLAVERKEEYQPEALPLDQFMV